MIRQATTEDIPDIRKMAEAAFPYTYREILSQAQIEYMMEMMYSEESLLRQMSVENNIFYLYDSKGYVSYRQDGRTDDNRDLFHLEKLYVLPQFQGLGIGRELFNTVIEAARTSSTGGFRIELNVNRHNNAVSFYDHIGMYPDRQGDFPIGNGYYMNDYIMAIDF